MGAKRLPFRRSDGELHVSVGHPLVDEYLQFLTARARPNTRLAVAFDLKVFFSVVDKTPVRVTSAVVRSSCRSPERHSVCAFGAHQTTAWNGKAVDGTADVDHDEEMSEPVRRLGPESGD